MRRRTDYSDDEAFFAGQFFKSKTSGLLLFQQQWLVQGASAVVLCLHGYDAARFTAPRHALHTPTYAEGANTAGDTLTLLSFLTLGA